MNELSDDVKEKIWKYIHRELDDHEDREFRTMASGNKAVDQEIQRCRYVDSLLAKAVRAEERDRRALRELSKMVHQNKSMGTDINGI